MCDNNNKYLSRVTLSVARTVINGDPDVQIELEFLTVLWREENWRTRIKTLGTNNKLNPQEGTADI